MSNAAFIGNERRSNPSAPGRRRSFKAALLGAVACFAVTSSIAPAFVGVAHAEAPVSQANAPASGPASFADLVARVKGAVVAIKVKSMETGGEGGEMPDISPDDPLYYSSNASARFPAAGARRSGL
jgi:serine protease Do